MPTLVLPPDKVSTLFSGTRPPQITEWVLENKVCSRCCLASTVLGHSAWDTTLNAALLQTRPRNTQLACPNSSLNLDKTFDFRPSLVLQKLRLP